MSLRSNTKILGYLAFVFLFLWSTSSCDLLNSKDNTANEPDTTSSNFVWTVDTLGKINTTFRDVAILDSGDIWIVGNIPEEDFDGGDRFNLLRISNSDTTKERIPAYWPVAHSPSILSIDQVNILDDGQMGLLMGAVFVYWDGRRFITDDRLRRMVEYDINLFEGPALDTLFFLGNNGTLFKKDEAGYKEIQTDLASSNSVAYYANDTLKFGTEFTLRQYVDGQVIPEFSPDAPEAFLLEGRYYDIWHSGAAWWYATSGGLYRFSPDSGYVQMTNQAVYAIVGNGENDVIAVDRTGEAIYHWNGTRITKMEFPEVPVGSPIRLEAIEMKANQVVIVGWVGSTFGNGVIVIGNRY